MNVSTHPQPLIIPRSEHSISRAAISANALKVLYRLKEAGYEAFLVGGAVRDLLLGITPKDFDVATNALPDDMRRLEPTRHARSLNARSARRFAFRERPSFQVRGPVLAPCRCP